jgi:hypothetical protein
VVWAPPGVRAIRAARGRLGADRAAGVLALAVRALPAGRAAWGEAMLVELHHAEGRRARWEFSLGCVRASASIRIRAAVSARDRDATGMRAILLSTVAVALGLAIYGLVRYPGLLAPSSAWPMAAVLVAVLVAYALCALTLLRGPKPHAARARGVGVIAGVVTGVAWLVVLSPTTALKTWVLAPLVITVASPTTVAIFTARASRDRTIATAVALWSGVVGGLVVFVTWVGATYLNHGRPYDSQLIRDFRHSGQHYLGTYAVSANLDVAVSLLVVIPVVCLALGSLAGRTVAHDH